MADSEKTKYSSGLSRFCRIKWEQARELRKEGKLAEAERELLEALEEAPEHPLLCSSLANLYLKQEKLLEARMLVEKILAADPQYLQALVVKGEIAFKEGNFAEALSSFEQAWPMDPRPYLAQRRARTLREMGRYREALELLDNTLITHRDNPRLLKEKALILNRLRKPDQALEVYERLRSLTPDDRFVQKEILRLKGFSRGKDTVIKELKTTIAMPSRRDEPQLRGLLAQKLKEAGRIEEAAAEYRTASELEPANPYFLRQQGFCHYALQQYPEALDCLGRAFRKDPSDYYVKGTLEKIYTELGRLDEFLALLQEVQRLHPHNRKLFGIIKKIKKRVGSRE